MQLFKKFKKYFLKTGDLGPKKKKSLNVSLISTDNDSFYLVCISQINNSEVHQIKNKDHSYQKSETQWKKDKRTNLGQVSLHAVIRRVWN